MPNVLDCGCKIDWACPECLKCAQHCSCRFLAGMQPEVIHRRSKDYQQKIYARKQKILGTEA